MTIFVFTFNATNALRVSALEIFEEDEFMRHFDLAGTYEDFARGGELADAIEFSTAEDALEFLDNDAYEFDDKDEWKSEITALRTK